MLLFTSKFPIDNFFLIMTQHRIKLLTLYFLSRKQIYIIAMCKFTQILQLPQNTKGGIARC